MYEGIISKFGTNGLVQMVVGESNTLVGVIGDVSIGVVPIGRAIAAGGEVIDVFQDLALCGI